MKKILLLIFVGFCCFIFYQMILGENGLIEGFRIKSEKERLLFYKSLLEKQKVSQNEYIKFLETSPKAYKQLAQQLGFYEKEVEIIKILKNSKDNTNDSYITLPETSLNIEKTIKEYETNNSKDVQIKDLRLLVSIIFYLFFGFFVIIIVLGGKKDG